MLHDPSHITPPEVTDNINLSQSVDPTNQILFSLSFTAPNAHGTYSNWFKMINADGVPFGDAFVVEIVVGTWEAKQTQLAGG